MNKEIKDEIPDIEKEILECFDNPIFKIENRHIVELDLTRNNLRSLPEGIGNLKSLIILNLEGNGLKSIPRSIENLKSLIELNLSYNSLISLPEGIGNLKSLENLYVKVNRLTSLPESIGNLTSLKYLILVSNQIATLPESFGNLRSLKFLNLYGNRLTFLPDSFKNLKSLENLNLRENLIKTLSNIPFYILNRTIVDVDYLTPKGKNLFKERKYEKLYKYFSKTSENIAMEYISNPVSLSVDEQERLIHEAREYEINILENNLTVDDPILKKIIERDSLELSNGFKIFL